MKKFAASLLIASTLLCCAACGAKSNQDTPDDRPTFSDDPLVQGITAATIGKHNLSSVELNYFYIDTINEYCNQYSLYLSYFFNTSIPLNEQIYDQATGETWGDAFLDMALDSAKNTYALYDAAIAAGHKLSAEEQAAVDEMYASMKPTAEQNGYPTVNAYLKSYYGSGASEQSYCDYYDITVLASSYYSKYVEDLEASYDDSILRQYEKDKMYEYNSYTYLSYYLSVDSFKAGGTMDSDGNVTYTAEEIAAAEEAAKEAAKALAIPDNNTAEKLNEALESDTCTENQDVLYSKVNSVLQEWLRSTDRKSGDITYIKYVTTNLDENGNKIETLKGYYVVVYQSTNTNEHKLPNVRHILIGFEGGHTDIDGNTTYTEDEIKVAEDQANLLLDEWLKGDADEASFAALANEHSTDPGSNANGGLYEEIVPGQMVTAFNHWCFAPERQKGDYGIIQTDYGFHIMYYSGVSDITYRDYQIISDKLQEDVQAWQEALNNSITATLLDDSRIDKGLILDNDQ